MSTNTPEAGALSRQEAANYLSISIRLLDQLLADGNIPKLKIGRKTLVRRVDLDTYLESLMEDESNG